MSRIDLHIHSNASDGRFSPEEIVKGAVGLGLTIIALTDHDTVDGIAPALSAAKAFPRLRVIPGVEISTDVPTGEVHVLGYFIDHTNSGLKTSLENMRSARRERAQKMLTKLATLGIYLDWGRVQEIAGSGTVGRPHVAQAMLEKGYISSLREAFAQYIRRDGPAYVEWAKVTPVKAVELVLKSHGLPVLAHPLTATDPEALTAELKQAGLVGIEVYYNSNSAEEIKKVLSLARTYGLLTTGGSDYHGLDEADETMMGGAPVPLAAAEALIALARERALIF